MQKILEEDSPDYILLLNDDMEFIEKNWLKKMVEMGESYENIGILGCKLIYPDGNLQWYSYARPHSSGNISRLYVNVL